MQHALFTAIRPCLSILFVVCALSCGPNSVMTESSPTLVNAQGRASLGYLEHRGEMYDLREWSSFAHDRGESNYAFTPSLAGPTIAGIGWLAMPSSIADVQFNMIRVDEPTRMFGLENPERYQCVEVTIID